MKIIIVITILAALLAIVAGGAPAVSVNYLNKKQWKLSKHDLADIKLDIEREVTTTKFILDENKNSTSSIRLGKQAKNGTTDGL